jgi:hypothetical protein
VSDPSAKVKDASFFRLSFRPNIKLVTTVREFTVSFYERVLVDPDLSSRLAYAVDDETTIHVEVDGGELVIKTWNRGSEKSVAALRSLMEEMHEAGDPAAFYQRLMARTALRSDGSGLGLVRVRVEAEMTLSCEIDRDRICIRAATPLAGGLAA